MGTVQPSWNPDKLERGADKNLMMFNKEKCIILDLERKKARHQDMLGASS